MQYNSGSKTMGAPVPFFCPTPLIATRGLLDRVFTFQHGPFQAETIIHARQVCDQEKRELNASQSGGQM